MQTTRRSTPAEILFDIYSEHRDNDNYIDGEGMQKLGDVFEAVDVSQRYQVFQEFLGLLDKNKVPYDKEQFKGRTVN